MSELEKGAEGQGRLVSSDPGSLVERTRHLWGQADSRNTLKAYRAAWSDFKGWCESQEVVLGSLPAAPETVAMYLADCSRRVAASTIRVRLSSIDRAHREAGLDLPGSHPAVRRVLKGIRREKGLRSKQATPLRGSDLRKALGSLPEGTKGVRDRALLLLGFHGAFRRSELASLRIEDVQRQRAGLVVTLRRSKTDQEGEGLEKGIVFQADHKVCPVRSLLAWLDAVGESEGPLFRAVDRHGRIGRSLTDRSVDLVVRQACGAAGLEGRFSAHSLRAGLATQAAEDGAPERVIMLQGGWTSIPTVRRYIRHGSLFRENVGTYLRLGPAA